METPRRVSFFVSGSEINRAQHARKRRRTCVKDPTQGNMHRNTKHAENVKYCDIWTRSDTPPASQDPEPIKRAATCTQCNSRSELLCNDKILMFFLDNSKIYVIWLNRQRKRRRQREPRNRSKIDVHHDN